MKKLVFVILIALGFTAYAQTPQSISIDFNKKNVPGVSMIIADYDIKVVQNALQYRFEKVAGLKGSSFKGFRMYAAQNFPYFGRLNYDIYTIVNKGTKKNPAVTVNLMVSKGNENFVSQQDEPEITQKMKDFLTEFATSDIKEYVKVQNIDNLNNTIKKLEKERNSLVSSKDKLKKDIAKLESQLKDKEKELHIKENEIQKAKAELEGLKR